MAKLANFLEGTAYGGLNDLLGYLNSDDGYATPNRFEVVLPTPAPSPVISGGGLFSVFESFAEENQQVRDHNNKKARERRARKK